MQHPLRVKDSPDTASLWEGVLAFHRRNHILQTLITFRGQQAETEAVNSPSWVQVSREWITGNLLNERNCKELIFIRKAKAHLSTHHGHIISIKFPPPIYNLGHIIRNENHYLFHSHLLVIFLKPPFNLIRTSPLNQTNTKLKAKISG